MCSTASPVVDELALLRVSVGQELMERWIEKRIVAGKPFSAVKNANDNRQRW